MIPHRTPFFLPLIFPSLIWRIKTAQPEIYLTFDDGPVDGPTDFVLDQLENAKIKSTFFCIGDNIRKHPHLFKRILTGGHVVANHTFNHLNGWKTTNDQYVKNITLFEQQLNNAGAESSTLFRPPYGRITFSQAKLLTNFKIIMWDVLTQDYNKNLDAEKCLRGSINAVRPGSIVVFHDSFKAEKNLRYVLPRLIDHFAAKGYQFKALS